MFISLVCSGFAFVIAGSTHLQVTSGRSLGYYRSRGLTAAGVGGSGRCATRRSRRHVPVRDRQRIEKDISSASDAGPHIKRPRVSGVRSESASHLRFIPRDADTGGVEKQPETAQARGEPGLSVRALTPRTRKIMMKACVGRQCSIEYGVQRL